MFRSEPVRPTANSGNDLEAWLAGMEATDGITMMFGVHGAEELGGGLVPGLFLSAAQWQNCYLAGRVDDVVFHAADEDGRAIELFGNDAELRV